MVEFSIEQLNKIMQNIGVQQFTYDTLKAAYDTDTKVADMIKDFTHDAVTLKTSEVDDLEPKKQKRKNTVASMAKKAVDLKGI
tara:strand:- start:1249 stop:1497 length:249 start_codon:yes stop_codon:yes gene_type:complete